MKRILAFVSLLAVGASAVLAQVSGSGVTQVEFFKVKNADGTYSISKGAPIFVTVKPIRTGAGTGADRSGRAGSFGVSPANGAKNIAVYKNHMGDNFVIEEGSSVVDDLSFIAAGNNKPWKIVTFGVHLATESRAGKFLVRWRGFQNYQTGLGPGNMAFNNEMFDFGFYLNRNLFPANESTFEVTVDLTLNPLGVVQNQTCYLAQQFREPQTPVEQGEGLFTSTWNVCTNNGPQIGASQDFFWFDYDPTDGIYDETEIDQFDPEQGGTGAANFLFDVQVSGGQTSTVNPISYNWVGARYRSGNTGSLWFNDANYNQAKAAINALTGQPSGRIVVESFSPTNNPVNMRVDVDARVSRQNVTMRIELFNFSTNTWVNVAQGPVGTTDTGLIGFAATPTQFVQSGSGVVRARLAFYAPSGPAPVWSMFVDQIVWTITAP
ncbi:MAG: hypothetical protein KF812_05035 [Fimbriimonadaceae bacterium]|nr:hypothetical protein [Fimbriimonadaceae bacterium]